MLNPYLESHRAHRRKVLRGAVTAGAALLAVAAAFGPGGCSRGGQAACPAVLPTCPSTVPTSGAPCPGSSPVGGCEYGSDPSYTCGTIATCDPRSGWFVQTLSDGLQCPTVLPSSCPPSFAEAAGASPQLACASLPANLTCLYPEGRCSCYPGLTVLTCPAAVPSGCPAARPRSGTPCSTAGPCTSWGTGICDGQSMICRCGLWQPVFCYD
jgi:hypothetical protein